MSTATDIQKSEKPAALASCGCSAEIVEQLRREAKINELCGSPEWTEILNRAAATIEAEYDRGVESACKLLETKFKLTAEEVKDGISWNAAAPENFAFIIRLELLKK